GPARPPRLRGGEALRRGGAPRGREGARRPPRPLVPVVGPPGFSPALHTPARRSRDERPMLASRSRAEVEALYRAREPYYRQADITVDTTALGPDQVATRVALALAERRSASGAARAAGA